MPYFIAKNREGCESGWAVVDDGGDLIACHDSKQSAIDNAVALSIATEEPFEGERAAVGSLLVGDYVTWVVDGETKTGEIYSVDGDMAQVKIYDDMGGFFVETVLITTVPVADLTRIAEPEVFEDEDETELLVVVLNTMSRAWVAMVWLTALSVRLVRWLLVKFLTISGFALLRGLHDT